MGRTDWRYVPERPETVENGIKSDTTIFAGATGRSTGGGETGGSGTDRFQGFQGCPSPTPVATIPDRPQCDRSPIRGAV